MDQGNIQQRNGRSTVNGGRPLVSIVVPCYEEEAVIEATAERLVALSKDTPSHDFELIFVDDGSADGTLQLLRALAEAHSEIKVLSFSRNFGHQIAVTAGIDAAEGDAVVLIDADLQDPPEIVPDMIALWERGYDVVYGTRAERSGESALKIATAKAFYRVLNLLSEVPIPLDTGDFRLMSREVVDVLKTMPERHRFVRGMVSWVGFKQTALTYERAERFAGTSKYPLRKMIAFAADGILSFSSKPLRVATSVGLMASILALLGIFYAVFMRLFTSVWVEGWTAIMIAVLFMGGVQLLSLGLIGEYIARIYSEAKGRPLYIVRERLGGRTEIVAGATKDTLKVVSAKAGDIR